MLILQAIRSREEMKQDHNKINTRCYILLIFKEDINYDIRSFSIIFLISNDASFASNSIMRKNKIRLH